VVGGEERMHCMALCRVEHWELGVITVLGAELCFLRMYSYPAE